MMCAQCKAKLTPGPPGEAFSVTVTTRVHMTISDPHLRDGLATTSRESSEDLCVPCAKRGFAEIEKLGLGNPLTELGL